MHPKLAYEFAQVTEAAALAGYKWLGRGDKNTADQAAVEAMRAHLNTMAIAGEIVIGEGEIDEAPMLYIGEKVGCDAKGDGIDIAVDPIEGTRMTAMGQSNAVAVLAAGDRGSLLSAPDMYMEKLVTGPKAKGALNLKLSLKENMAAVATALNKPLTDLTLVTLDKPRHQAIIEKVRAMGCKVFALPDGDVAASILTCLPESDVDIMYCVGGAPEGVISAAAIRALGGDMQARLLLRSDAKGQNEENNKQSLIEKSRCKEMGVEPMQVLQLDDMAKSDNVIFSVTGITKGDLVDGVHTTKGSINTETLLISGISGCTHRIRTSHRL